MRLGRWKVVRAGGSEYIMIMQKQPTLFWNDKPMKRVIPCGVKAAPDGRFGITIDHWEDEEGNRIDGFSPSPLDTCAKK
jgi:hypothetical protein